MSELFNEQVFENALVSLCETELGYTHVYGYDVDRDYKDCLYEEELNASIRRINPGIPEDAINSALFTIKNRLEGTLVQRNEQFHNYLQNSVEVSCQDNGKTEYHRVKLIDFDNVEKNSFVVANQWTITGSENKRPDVILFINGIPLVLMELKSCSREQTDVSDAYLQIRNYMQIIPQVFYYNAFCIISDMLTTRAGTITADETRFMAWKTIDGSEYLDNPDFSILIKGMLEKNRLLDIIRNFIVFQKEEKGDIKILAAYHQYFAVHKALDSTLGALGTTKKGGVFWHTQGSGKSLSMLFLTHLLRERLTNPTIVVLTDRNDLDNQLYSQFAKCHGFLRTEPQNAGSCEELTTLLSNTEYGGIYFSTMQKFEETSEPFSLRDNIIILADEAHRSQYGLDEKFDVKNQKMKKGYARMIRDALPNATFVGFTGTPISNKDHSTIEVFGDTIDVYDMTQSVKDGATRPVYYESRVMNLKFDHDILKEIDDRFNKVAEDSPEYTSNLIETQKQIATMESLLNNPTTIDTLVSDIIKHYEGRKDILAGKAMVVAYSRAVAISIYKKMLEMRPDWTEKVKVVMTGSNQDPEDWHAIIGGDKYKQELAKKFKDTNDPMKIAIVVDMWLTGFDVPSLNTMYVFKPMAGHNLMQAIARVNRVFKDKEGGLVVDYIGIIGALKLAMKDFTKRDNQNYGNMDIAATALIEFRDRLEVCQTLFHGFNISPFITGTDIERATTITSGLNFILGLPEKKKQFMEVSYQLRQAASLCRSLQDKTERYYAAFFETIRVAVNRLENTRGNTGKVLRNLSREISDLLNQSVQTSGVINLFDDFSEEFSLLDPLFLQDVARMKEKNIASELLRKLLQDKIHQYKRNNVVKAGLFSEKMEEIMNRWRNLQITNAEVIEELLKLADEIQADSKEANDLGLTEEEKAFYDALTKPEAVRDFYENEQLVALTKELTDTLRRNRSVDWNKKESARAEMRKMVKRLLKKYNYPPEAAAGALKIVLEQCELWTENEAV